MADTSLAPTARGRQQAKSITAAIAAASASLALSTQKIRETRD